MNTTTDTTPRNLTSRNQDVDLLTEAAPDGHYIHFGERLMLTARAAGIQYGEATKGKTRLSKRIIVGLVIRKADKKRMTEAIARKHAQNEAKGRTANMKATT